MPKAKAAPKPEEEVEQEEGDILLHYGGVEDVREVNRKDLLTYPDSETVLTWDASNSFVSPVKLTEDEVQVLARSGGSWSVVTGEFPTPESEEPIVLPTVDAASVAPPPAPAPVETQVPPQVTEETVETQAGVDPDENA